MKKIIIIMLLVALTATMFTGCVQETKVEGTVIACEKGRVEKNSGAKTMATFHFVQGNTTQALLYNNIGNMETQWYDVTIEYEGVQYTIETKTEYEAGDTILFYLPQQ